MVYVDLHHYDRCGSNTSTGNTTASPPYIINIMAVHVAQVTSAIVLTYYFPSTSRPAIVGVTSGPFTNMGWL